MGLKGKQPPKEPNVYDLLRKVNSYALKPYEKTILRLLIEARYKQGLTQVQVSKLTGIKLYRLQWLERGKLKYAYNKMSYIQ